MTSRVGPVHVQLCGDHGERIVHVDPDAASLTKAVVNAHGGRELRVCSHIKPGFCTDIVDASIRCYYCCPDGCGKCVNRLMQFGFITYHEVDTANESGKPGMKATLAL
jgi:hypothetical protein